MNQQELIEQVAEQGRVAKSTVGLVLAALGEVAQRELAMEEGVIPLHGIGKIKATVRAGRAGRNPQTGEPIEIPPMNSAKLVLSTELKRAIA